MIVMNMREVCDYMQISTATLWRLREYKQLPYFKIGRRLFFSKADIDKWLERRKVS